MRTSVPKAIGDLLYQYDKVVIPGLGNFKSEYKSSWVDHVQGLLYPPSKYIQFDKEDILNDGILYKYIQQANQMDYADAREFVTNFVLEAQDSLKKREIIIFPQVGRLFMDYEEQIQFIADNNNFNKDAFGLAVVNAYPILRTQQNLAPQGNLAGQAAVANVKTAEAKPGTRKRWRMSSSMVIASSLLLFAIGLFFLTTNKQTDTIADVHVMPVSEKRVNMKPGFVAEDMGLVENGKSSKTEKSAATKANITKLVDEDGVYQTDFDTDGSTLGPDINECVIIIGQFKNRDGVKKRIQELYELGFDAYKDKNPKNGLTRVGAQFAYEEYNEVRKTLKLLQKKFDKHSWVMKE